MDNCGFCGVNLMGKNIYLAIKNTPDELRKAAVLILNFFQNEQDKTASIIFHKDSNMTTSVELDGCKKQMEELFAFFKQKDGYVITTVETDDNSNNTSGKYRGLLIK